MAEERDDQEFGGTEAQSGQQQPTGQQGQQSEFGQQQNQQPTGSEGGQASESQSSGDSETLTADNDAQSSTGQGGQNASQGEGFIGSQGNGSDSDEYLQAENGSTEAGLTEGSDFASQGQGAPDESEEESGSEGGSSF